MKEFTAERNRTLPEILDVIKELRETGQERKIRFIELVRDYDGTYYANMTWDGASKTNLRQNVDFRTLQKDIYDKTGVSIPKLKFWEMRQYGRKTYGYLQAMVVGKGCMVEQ